MSVSMLVARVRWCRFAALAGALPVVAACAARVPGPVPGAEGSGGAPARGEATVDAALLRLHTGVLAHDSMEGRGTASRGEARAAAYLTRRLQALGLRPLARPDGDARAADFRIPVRLTAYPADASRASFRIRSGDGPRTLHPPDFYHPGGSPSAFRDFAGELLLAGPTPGALAALADFPDLTGRVVVLGPPWTGVDEVKVELLRRGAAGAVTVVPGALYDRLRVARGPVRFSLAGEVSDSVHPGRLPSVVVGPDAVGALGLAGAVGPPGSAGRAGAPGRARALGVRVEASLGLRPEPRTGYNLVAMLPGSDPELAREYVLFLAHYDHVGVGQPAEDGDSIWNGFVDNAAGAAVLLEVARVLAADPPDRSVIFLFTTGEEQGLLGATSFVHDPLVPLERIRAAINIDGGAPPPGIREWFIAAPEGSRVGALASAALEEAGQDVTASPLIPDSDHWAFHRAGVPALFLLPGDLAADLHPHTPEDEWRSDFPFEGLVRYAEAALRIGRAVAESRMD